MINQVDKAILDIDRAICRNISKFDDSDRGLLSQNILAQLRNFVEYIAIKIYSNGSEIDPNCYDEHKAAMKFLKSRNEWRFLWKFHGLLQKSVSHYTMDENGSERLMLKYYEYLLKIKIVLRNEFDLQVLYNIEKFPLNTDRELAEYYEKIAERISRSDRSNIKNVMNDDYDKYYIQKIKPFFVKKRMYYEITFSAANDKRSKFDRIIAFSRHEILSNYAVRLSLHYDSINVLGREMTIQIIDSWNVSIRKCELENFAKILGQQLRFSTTGDEYIGLMKFLTKTGIPLSEFVACSEEFYYSIKEQILNGTRRSPIFNLLDECREKILSNRPGANVLKYLLYHLNNKIIKDQLSKATCYKLSNLYLHYGCIPFDEMPLCTSLRNHNPNIYDLLDCFSDNERDHELFARYIRKKTEIENVLFTSERDIERIEDYQDLVDKYNSKLYLQKHMGRQLKEFKKNVYIKQYAEDSFAIIKKLRELGKQDISQYTASVDSWLSKSSYSIDCIEKKNILRQLFDKSRVALIYGAAGTGKSTLINHIANFFSNERKLFLANTHPAVDNMRRKITASNREFKTIASFLNGIQDREYDILVIDECSMVSNSDMRKILEKCEFEALILVGDVYQISSIYFGNWFDIARELLDKNSIFELTEPYRTKNKKLLDMWNYVRNMDPAMLEEMVRREYSMRLDNSIFSSTEQDEIILCLNYDGLYGINNINRFLQNCNPEKEIEWGTSIYKIGDPILFNESSRFSPLIYNNSKGYIRDIKVEKMQIWFDIELDCTINELDARKYDFELVNISENGNSIIRFNVKKYKSADEDYDNLDVVVPFQIAYAISIHKAQGLEYNSVKIVITNEVEERISHNIFYTAITRAKEKLKIYWSPETESCILKNWVKKDLKRDMNLLKQLYSL